MGVAAYNRGTNCHRRQITEEINSEGKATLEVVERLNCIPKRDRAARLSIPCIIRCQPKLGWWLMQADEQCDGWGAYGFLYQSLKDLMADNRIKITGFEQDNVSFLYHAKPT